MTTTTPKLEQRPTVSRSRVVISQVLACLALNWVLMGLGVSVSFVTVVLPHVQGPDSEIQLTKEQVSWLGSMAFLCQPLGSIFSGPLMDYMGRKKALFLVNIPHVIAWTLMYLAWDVPSLFAANALLGIGTGIMEGPSVTYVGEICDVSVRGILTTMTNTFTGAGIFFAYLLGTVLPWKQAALVNLTFPFVAMLLVVLIPETPIWLLSKGRQKEAIRSLCRLRGWTKPEDVKEEFNKLLEYKEIITQCVICVSEGKTCMTPCEHKNLNVIHGMVLNFKHVFFVKETLRPFSLVICYFFFHTMSGVIPLRPNMVNTCKALGMKYDSKVIVVSVGAIFIAMALLSAALVKFIGKRKLAITAIFATSLCSLGLSFYAGTNLSSDVFSYEPDTFPKIKELLPVVLFIMLVCFTGLGIPWILLSEVFPFRSRGTATGVAAAFAYIIFFVASKTHYNIEALIHLSGTFAFYALCGFMGTVYLYFFLPETEQKSLAEIEAYYKGKHKIFADDFIINIFKKKQKRRIEADNLL